MTLTHLTVDDMCGKTPQARELQFKQLSYLDSFYEAVNEAARRGVSYNDSLAEPAVAAAKAAYEQSVTDLCAMLGDQAHCNEVDSELWSSFSDLFKSINNFRPRGQFTKAAVESWMDSLTTQAPAPVY